MYEMDLRVRYSETDLKGRVRLFHILDYFQDVATFHSMALHLEAGGDLAPGHVWYLLSWDIKVCQYPVLGDKVKIITEPYKMKGFYGYRRFFIRDGEDRLMAEGDSIWVLMDIEKNIPVRISDELTRAFVKPGVDDTITVKRKLPVSGDWREVETFEVSDIFLDSNLHVNNAFYVQWACMVLPKGRDVSRLKVDYRQSARKGDALTMHLAMDEEVYRVKFTNQEGTLISLVDLHIGDLKQENSDV